jgi:2-succinyl-5-enolpyruvyl-6-hydroxy-3-cyclohexene-1-carboxylate synthase
MIDRTNRNTALASALVDELARGGARRAFLSPGSRSSPVALALDAHPAVDLEIVLDERSAAFAALGASLASGEPALIACTSGSAAANYLPAVVEAEQAGVPLIVLTSDRPPELRGIGAGQTIDQIGLYGTAVRWFCELGTHEADDAGLLHMRSSAARAIAEARLGRGPVHVNAAWRDPLGPEERPGDVTASDELALEGRSEGRPITVPIPGRGPGGEALGALAAAIDRAERPLIVAGRQTDPGLPAAIVELAAAARAPVLADPTSGLRFGGPHGAVVVDSYDLIARDAPDSLLPDLVIRFGDMPTSKPLRAWLDGSGVDVIAVDPPGRWNEPSRRAGALIRADARAVAGGVAARIAAGDEEWPQRWRGAGDAAARAVDEVLASEERPTEPAIHRTLAAALADGDQLMLASSMPIRDAEAFMRRSEASVRAFSNRGANGIDGLVSTACGLAIGGAAPTWLVLGDLALAHDLGGLAATRLVASPLRIVVIDNGGGGIFDFLPQAAQVEPERFERLFTTPSELDLERVAALFELPFAEVASLADLEALAKRDLVLARVRVERGGNVELHGRLAAAVAVAIREAG